MAVRVATEADIPAIADLALATADEDAFMNYRSPLRKQYPAEERNYMMWRATTTLRSLDTYFTVYETADKQNPAVQKVVAFCGWKLPAKDVKAADSSGSNGQATSSTPEAPPAPHLSQGRADAVNADSEKVSARITAQYGKDLLTLGSLACHPDYQRQGIATTLCGWGLRKAQSEGLPVLVLASPLGRKLYLHLGFKDEGSFRTQLDGEDDFLDIYVLVLPRQAASVPKAVAQA